jgi:hypothetical protein
MYYEKLLKLSENALLHLYITISVTNGFVSQSARNAILVKFLKPKIKSPEYKLIKKDIQTFVRAGRSKEIKLETKLIKLIELSFIVING